MRLSDLLARPWELCEIAQRRYDKLTLDWRGERKDPQNLVYAEIQAGQSAAARRSRDSGIAQ